MEENIVLESEKKKQFVKSIKGIKNLIKKSNAKSIPENITKKTRDGKITKKKLKKRGLVYLSHIPHGFYEHQMTQYFKQFGVVTNARVIRSKRTGNSKGHAFVEFKEPAVAQIVAETMNNYLMGKRLIKAALIPPEKQRKYAQRKFWNPVHNPSSELRIKLKKAYNANKTEGEELKRAKKLLTNLSQTKKKLKELGIDYSFFKAVDIPEALQNELLIKQEKDENIDNNCTVVKDSGSLKTKKKNKKVEKVEKDENIDNNCTVKDNSSLKTKKKNKKVEKVEVEAVKVKEQKLKTENKREKNKQKTETVSKKGQNKSNVKDENDIEQKAKQKKKESNLKPPEDFIKIEENSDGDSDSSYNFDSDAYEKALNDEDEYDSDISSVDDSDNNEKGGLQTVSDIPVDEDEITIAKQTRNKNKTKKQKGQLGGPVVFQNKSTDKIDKKINISSHVKRKAIQKDAVAPRKKPKFEKRSEQKKHIKKRK